VKFVSAPERMRKNLKQILDKIKTGMVLLVTGNRYR
jgi:hypothetical protein